MLPIFSESWTNLLIMGELKKIEPSLDLQGGDHKLLRICCDDFKNYSDYLEVTSVNSEGIMPSGVAVEMDLATGDYHVEETEETAKIVEFLMIWVKGWWKKYKIRVQVTIVESPRCKPSKTRQKGTMMMSKFSEDEINDIKKAIVQTLIKSGEICCTDILADSLFKSVLGRYSEKVVEWTQEKKLNFMASVLREAKRVSYTHGPLIFIKPDKKCYELREFRDDTPQPL